jgi:hypothetical protein
MARALVHIGRHLVSTHPFTIHHINRSSGGKRVTFIEMAAMALTRGENDNLSFQTSVTHVHTDSGQAQQFFTHLLPYLI